ncbi:MAG: transporter [Gammaproteobacteria bacterium HGW-Gammaproteobacteria-3]|jgi:predicted lipid-binding transport protein (Tim44 family)|nr:MAG: transporter [Gammaproteobacteria bacterium HGW-Gammaproteobacteria-3]
MNKYTGIIATALIGLSLSLGGIDDAEAKRFGGGGSFGGKSSFSSPYKRSAISPTRSASQQQAYNKNQTARQGLANRGGLMGMLGGLALGGLLGAMFFGGAFEGLNFMDLLMFGGIAFVLYKLFAARAKAGSAPQAAYNKSNDDYRASDTSDSYSAYKTPESYSSAGFDTDILFDKDKKTGSAQSQPDEDAHFNTASIPQGFDEPAFLAGAKAAFKDLQVAWDNRDLAEIRGLTTDKVFAEIKEQLSADNDDNHTDVLKVEAELLEVREIGANLEAVVMFDTLLREDEHAQARQVREVWHFTKAKNSIQPTWFLDGIQQLED